MAVGAGRVLHLGPMPGYGTIVIVDHGARSYSLYGKMGEILVERGSDVTQGDTLGRLNGADKEASNFYFEIRKNGTPVDPAPYLRQR
jgi:lipoprotein NlpD